MSTNIPLGCADITDREIQAVSDALRGEVHTLGSWTQKFESAVATRATRTFAVAVSSSSSAMQTSLDALGVRAGDEVILPTFDSPSTTASVIRLGAVPVFIDCDARTLNCNVEEVASKITSKTKVIIATHTFGNPTGIEAIASIAMRNEIPLLEDAGQALGSAVQSRPAGSFGRVAIFSFHAASQLTSLEGGVIVTDDDHLATLCQSIRNHGLSNDSMHTDLEMHQIHDNRMVALGHGFRLSEVHAAVGVTQMNRIEEIMQRRSTVADWYTRRLGGVADVMCPTIDSDINMNWYGYVIRLSDRFGKENRDQIIRGLHRHDIGAADFYRPVHTLPPILKVTNQQSHCPVAESISERTLALPLFTSMTKREVDIVCQTLELMMTRSAFAE